MLNFFKKEKKYKEISVNELDELIGKIELIDIREANEYEEMSIKTARNIPMLVLLQDPDKFLSREKTYYIVCLTGKKSEATVEALVQKGFSVVNVKDGVSNYQGVNKK